MAMIAIITIMKCNWRFCIWLQASFSSIKFVFQESFAGKKYIYKNNRGVYWIWNSYFCPPPLFLIYIFSKTEIYYNGGGARRGRKIFSLFLQFFTFLPIWEKICILFTNWGKNMHFPPFFIPFQLLFGHIFVKQKIHWNLTGEGVKILILRSVSRKSITD